MADQPIVALPVDTEGQPVIVQCPADDCPDLDLWTMECAPGFTWVCVCGAGHMSWIMKEPAR